MTDTTPPLKPPSTLLMGGVGTGKTYSLTTYMEAGLKLVALILEPGGEEAILNGIQDKGLDINNFYYRYIPFGSTSWEMFKDLSWKVQKFDYESLAKLKSGIGKAEFSQMNNLFEVLSDFTCQRSGTHLGPLDLLDDTYAVSLDSITGLNQMCIDLAVGAKPSPHPGEWGTAMGIEERLLNKLNSDLNCFFCGIAHLDRQFVEVEGKNMYVPGMLGSKLAPRVPRMFRDVIVTKRDAGNFLWASEYPGADTKATNLPWSDKLPPSFVPLVERYHARKALIATSNTSTTPTTDGGSIVDEG